jgi:hypothetical protein
MPRNNGKKRPKGTNNAAQALAKAASDAAVASTGLNPTPMGRPWPTQEAGVQLLSPPLVAARGTEEREEAMKRGEDAGLRKSKRKRPPAGALAYDIDDDDDATAQLEYVSVSEGQARTAIFYMFVHTLGAPGIKDPKHREWFGTDGTIAYISKTLKVQFGTVQDVLSRCAAAEENKMNVDVSERFSDGTGKHNARIVLGSAEADLLIGCLSKGWGTRWATYIINSKRKRGTKPLCTASVRTAFKRFRGRYVKRPKRKTGSRNPACAWAVARDVGFRQFLVQLYLGEGMSLADAVDKVNNVAVKQLKELTDPADGHAQEDEEENVDADQESTPEWRLLEMDFEDPFDPPTPWTDDEVLDFIVGRGYVTETNCKWYRDLEVGDDLTIDLVLKGFGFKDKATLMKEIISVRKIDPAVAADQDDVPLQPLWLDGTLFIDEHTEYCVLRDGGSNGQGDKDVAVLPMKDGKIDLEDGVYEDPVATVYPKFRNHADGVFAVAAPTFSRGGRKGVKAEPLQYTGQLVIGVKTYNRHLKEEFAKVKKLKHPFGVKGLKFKTDNPYEERFGADWRAHLPNRFTKKYRCITEVMDWAICEGNRLFANSTHADDWVIYHDR